MGDRTGKPVRGLASGDSLCYPVHTTQDLDRTDKLESAALLCVVWRNNLTLIESLLDGGAKVDCQDNESYWTGLHRALYWGHIRAAAKLLQAGAHTSIQDSKGRTPVDLVSVELKRFLVNCRSGDIYSWGNGANYQLGTGSTGVLINPVRIDSLHNVGVVQLAAGKFHSVALTADGKVYTWGWGRGGRLGHPEFHIHSGESAVIVPRLVEGLGKRQVAVIAAAKHHTVIATVAGEVWTWGSNREGRLGYPAVDTQPTPRRVSNLKQNVVKVAAANKHTVVATSSGVVYSWGSNLEGQLGYGTSDSSCNPTPRMVEAMKGKHVCEIAAAKRHTVVLSDDGEVFTWGHKVVTPRRVNLAGARDPRLDTGSFKLHKGHADVMRPLAISIAAGATHSSCLTTIGVVLTWASTDSSLQVHEAGGALVGKKGVHIAAGKTRTAVVTDEGDVYVWDSSNNAADGTGVKKSTKVVLGSSPGQDAGEVGPDSLSRSLEKSQGSGTRISRATPSCASLVPQRIDGLKRVGLVAVGEKHSCALQTWCRTEAPSTAPSSSNSRRTSRTTASSLSSLGQVGFDVGTGEFELDEYDLSCHMLGMHLDEDQGQEPDACAVPTLQLLCEKAVERQVDPRNVLQLLEYSDILGATQLRRHCLAVALYNLDAVILEGRSMFEAVSPHLLAELEHLYKTQILHMGGDAEEAAGPSVKLSRRPTAAPEAEGDNVDDEESLWRQSSLQLPDNEWGGDGQHRNRESSHSGARCFSDGKQLESCAEMQKLLRNLKKKLQQIENLEKRRAKGSQLDPQQQMKVSQKPLLQCGVEALEGGAAATDVMAIMQAIRGQAEAVGQQQKPKKAEDTPQSSRLTRKSSKKPKNKGKPTSTESPTTSSLARPSTASTTTATSKLDSDTEDTATSTFQPVSSAPATVGLSTIRQPSADPATTKLHQETCPFPVQPSSTVTAQQMPTQNEWDRLSQPGSPGLQATGVGASPGQAKGSKKKGAVRKGGLSMFLSGELEKKPEPVVVPKVVEDGSGGGGKGVRQPAWGTAIVPPAPPSALASLKAIQQQEASAGLAPESKLRGVRPSTASDGSGVKAERCATLGGTDGGTLRVSLAQLVKQSSPIAVNKSKEKPPPSPAWGGVHGSSPVSRHASLREIQAEQQHKRESIARSWGTSPGRGVVHPPGSQGRRAQQNNATASGSSPGNAFPLGSSPSSTARVVPQAPQHNSSKWYVPNQTVTQQLRNIQTEQTAINQLAKLYGEDNVKVVIKR